MGSEMCIRDSFKVLEAAAALHDVTRIAPRPTRRVNVGELTDPGEPPPDDHSDLLDPDAAHWEINAAEASSTRIESEHFSKLTRDGRRMWIGLSKEDKLNLIAGLPRSANVHTLDVNTAETETADSPLTGDTGPDSDPGSRSANVHQRPKPLVPARPPKPKTDADAAAAAAKAKALAEAHCGDPRRLQSPQNSVAKRSANTVTWKQAQEQLPAQIQAYWSEQHSDTFYDAIGDPDPNADFRRGGSS